MSKAIRQDTKYYFKSNLIKTQINRTNYGQLGSVLTAFYFPRNPSHFCKTRIPCSPLHSVAFFWILKISGKWAQVGFFLPDSPQFFIVERQELRIFWISDCAQFFCFSLYFRCISDFCGILVPVTVSAFVCLGVWELQRDVEAFFST